MTKRLTIWGLFVCLATVWPAHALGWFDETHVAIAKVAGYAKSAPLALNHLA